MFLHKKDFGSLVRALQGSRGRSVLWTGALGRPISLQCLVGIEMLGIEGPLGAVHFDGNLAGLTLLLNMQFDVSCNPPKTMKNRGLARLFVSNGTCVTIQSV